MTRSRKMVDEGSAGGWLGEPGCLDLVVAVAEAAQVVGERGPPGGGVSDVPVAGGGRADAAAGQVPGCPAAGELAGVVGLGVAEDGRVRGLGPGRRPGGGGTPGWAVVARRLARRRCRRRVRVARCAGAAGCWRGSRDGRGVVAVQDAVGVADDAGGGGGDAVPGGEDGCGGLGARVACRPSLPGRQAAPLAVTPWRAQVM